MFPSLSSMLRHVFETKFSNSEKKSLQIIKLKIAKIGKLSQVISLSAFLLTKSLFIDHVTYDLWLNCLTGKSKWGGEMSHNLNEERNF